MAKKKNRYKLLHKTSLWAVIILFILCQAAIAQKTREFVSHTGGFSIALPEDTSGVDRSGTAGGIRFSWDRTEAEYNIGFFEVKGLPQATKNGELGFDLFIEKYLNSFSQRGQRLSEKQITFKGKTGTEYEFSNAGEAYLFRLFNIEGRLYQLLAKSSVYNTANKNKILSVFDSFEFIDREVSRTEIEKKLLAATPKSISQSPVVTKLKADLDDLGLKGKIKSVFTEVAFYNLKNILRDKKASSYEEFDENGRLLKRIEYDDLGNPMEVKIFGFIAGKRVSRQGSVDYGYDFEGGIAISFPKRLKSDARFDWSYTYKYLNGKLIEERTFFNNGVLMSRATYKYLGTKKETLLFDGGNKPHRKIVSEVDSNGNEIFQHFKELGYNIMGSDEDKYEIRYGPLDNNGNWKSRTIYRWYGIENQGSFQPEHEEYRTIVYY